MPKPVEAKATVTLTIEINVGDQWADTCPISQLHDQAASAALGMIRNLSPQTAVDFARRIRVIGDPKVSAILATRDF